MFGRKKKENTVAFRRAMADRLNGMTVKYVTERAPDGSEIVVGRRGAVLWRGDELIVHTFDDRSSARPLFRCDVDFMTAGELMSGDGVILTAADKENGGAVRTVVVYFTYHLK